MNSSDGRGWTRHRSALICGALAAVIVVSGLVVGALNTNGVPTHGHRNAGGRLEADVCGGPSGTAFVADAGYDAFSQINTANCAVVQNGGYNVGDPPVAGDSGDYDYSSTDEGVVATGGNLWFADTGANDVAVINIASLDPSDYNPTETLINTGFNPQSLAATPDGSEVWVTDTGPETSRQSPSDVDVISTSTDTVTATIELAGAPNDIAFSPDGEDAYITTANGLAVYDVANESLITEIGGLDDPRGVAVSPNGDLVYVTNAGNGTVSVIDTQTNAVTGSITVGSLPWQVVFNPTGTTAYVADPDSNQVSVIDVATSSVTATIAVPGDPDALALTTDPGATELWVGENAAGSIAVVDTATHSVESTISLGSGYEPTGIAIVG